MLLRKAPTSTGNALSRSDPAISIQSVPTDLLDKPITEDSNLSTLQASVNRGAPTDRERGFSKSTSRLNRRRAAYSFSAFAVCLSPYRVT